MERQRRLDIHVHLLEQRYRSDRRRFGPHFVTTYPFDGTLDDMCYVMQGLQSQLSGCCRVSMANTYQLNQWILGVMHVTTSLH